MFPARRTQALDAARVHTRGSRVLRITEEVRIEADPHQDLAALTGVRHLVPDRMAGPRPHTTAVERQLTVDEPTVVRRRHTEAGLLVTVADPMAGQRLPTGEEPHRMAEAEQLHRMVVAVVMEADSAAAGTQRLVVAVAAAAVAGATVAAGTTNL